MIMKTKRILGSILVVALFVTLAAGSMNDNQSGLPEDSNLASVNSEITSDISSLSHESNAQEAGETTPGIQVSDESSYALSKETDKETDKETELEGITGDHVVVHFIDVGQGDSILIQTSSEAILIDGGSRGTLALDYLKANKISELDLVVGTHPHEDHIGGLINVILNIPVKEVLDPGVEHTTKTFEDYLTVIDEKDIKFTQARAGMEYSFTSGLLLEVLHPQNPSLSHLNDASIVIRLAYGDVSFMLTGDAEQSSEAEILGRGKNLSSTVLKVGHHGSRTSTTQAFLNAVNPEIAIIMCGNQNTYNHPHTETLDKLSATSVEVYRTDLHRTIVVTTDGNTYSIEVNHVVSTPIPTIRPTTAVTSAPTSTNAPTATTTPIPAPTNTPAATPTGVPSATLSVVSYTEQVKAGQTATITIKGKANTDYSIIVTYKSGTSTADGLGIKKTDGSGNVSWSWVVGTQTTKGSWPITITGGGESVKVYFEVT